MLLNVLDPRNATLTQHTNLTLQSETLTLHADFSPCLLAIKASRQTIGRLALRSAVTARFRANSNCKGLIAEALS